MLLPKTLEFPYPNHIPPEWLAMADRIWNNGLHLLEWRQYWLQRQKCLDSPADPMDFPEPPQAVRFAYHKNSDGKWGVCSRLGYDRRIDKSKSWDKENLEYVPDRQMVFPWWLNEPPIDGYSYFSVAKRFTKKVKFDYGTLPSGIMQSVVKNLCDTWSRYQKGKGGRPRYRGKRNPIKSLSYDGFRHHCDLEGDRVRLLGMPMVVVPQLAALAPLIEATAQYLVEHPSDRVLKKAEEVGLIEAARFYAIPGCYNLIQHGDRTFLQLAGEFVEVRPKARDTQITITTNEAHLWATKTEGAKHHDIDHYERRIKALQRVAAAKEFGSRNWGEVQDKIRALQRRSRKAVRGQHHYHAQMLATNAEITIKPYTPPILPAPIPIPDGDGGYAPNGATAIAEANVRRAKAATAQFVAILSDTAKKTGAVVVDDRKKTAPTKGRNRKREKAIKGNEKREVDKGNTD